MACTFYVTEGTRSLQYWQSRMIKCPNYGMKISLEPVQELAIGITVLMLLRKQPNVTPCEVAGWRSGWIKRAPYSFWVSDSCLSCVSSSVLAVKETKKADDYNEIRTDTGFPVTSQNRLYLQCTLYNRRFHITVTKVSHLQGQHCAIRLLSVGLSAVAQLTNEQCTLQDKCFFVQCYRKWRRMTLCVRRRCERVIDGQKEGMKTERLGHYRRL